MEKIIVGTGIFNLDIIVVREYPAFLAALKDAPAVFFFDEPAASNRALAVR